MARNYGNTYDDIFDGLKREILKLDPVFFASEYLTIDGKPLCLGQGTGWKYLADIYRYIAIKAIEPDGKPVVCVKGRQVGATTMATALELYFCTSGMFGASPSKPPIKILHCFPALNFINKFAKEKLSTMMRTSKDNYVLKQSLGYDEKTGKRRGDVPDDTLSEKQFKNENKLWVESNGNDAVRLQGMSLDAIFYDEVQHMNQDDIGNSQRTLTAAKYGPRGEGIQLFFGTPLMRGSNFSKMWEASDKRYYHLGCAKCQDFFMLYTPGTNEWENIWLYQNVVRCTKCGFEQDKVEAIERGKWVSSRPLDENGEEPKYIGFHFNQLLLPNFHKETIINLKPGVHPTNTERIWQNEILGEFYSGSDLPMTAEEIYKYCRNLNKSISFGTPNIRANNGSKVISPYQPLAFMGMDWGQKDDVPGSKKGKSFSSVVVVSVDQSGVLQIENAFKLKSNKFEHKKEVVREMFRRFNITTAVADLGGSDIVPELQSEFGGRILGCMNSGSLVNPIRYDPEELRLMCNHNIILEELFNNMRKSKVLFPWKSYEQIQWLIEHCCSMEKEVRTLNGRVFNRYVKGTGPNDGLMSLLYSYLAYKFTITSGFRVKQFQLNSKNKGPVLAYMPGF